MVLLLDQSKRYLCITPIFVLIVFVFVFIYNRSITTRGSQDWDLVPRRIPFYS